MIWVRIILGGIKVLLILGVIETIAPGLSHDISKQLVLSAFKLGGK